MPVWRRFCSRRGAGLSGVLLAERGRCGARSVGARSEAGNRTPSPRVRLLTPSGPSSDCRETRRGPGSHHPAPGPSSGSRLLIVGRIVAAKARFVEEVLDMLPGRVEHPGARSKWCPRTLRRDPGGFKR